MTRRARRALDVALWTSLTVGSVLVVVSPHTGTGPWWIGMALLAAAAVSATVSGIVASGRRGPGGADHERVRT